MAASLLNFRVFSCKNYVGSVISASAEDTIEDLKLEIYCEFGIKPSKQVIEGWVNPPESDDTQLKHCCAFYVENQLVLKENDEMLTISVVFDGKEAVFQLEREATVEILKTRVNDEFGIPVNKISLDGWYSVPETDNTPLLYCCDLDKITSLVVKSMAMPSNGREEEVHNILEIESALSFTDSISKKLKSMANLLTFHVCELHAAIQEVCLAPLNKKKTILLFFYNSEDKFSKLFLECLESKDVVKQLHKSYFLIGWDVEQTKYHGALVRALNNYTSTMCLAEMVRKKVSAAICIVTVENNPSIASCLRGNVSKKDILNTLKNMEEFLNAETKCETELQAIREKVGNEFDIGPERFQTIMADRLGDRDYDRFEHNEHDLLRDKIGFALKGPPESEEGYDKDDKDINKIFEVIKSESDLIAQYKDTVEIAFMYNCTEPLPDEKVTKANKAAKDSKEYNPDTDMNPRPIFVLRKCHGSANPCRVFIDDTCRVYQSWTGYILRNKLPKCQMILPRGGKYDMNEDGRVLLERHLSPACGIDVKLLAGADITATVGGLFSGGIFLAAAIPAITVAPIALVVGGVAGVAVGLYSIGRSIHTLADRKIHKESLSFSNSEARGAYVNIVAGSLGFVGAGANLAVSQLAAGGVNIAQGARTSVTVLGAVNIAASGAGIINSGYDVFDQWFNQNQKPSLLTMVQLSSSILFFGNAVYNFRTGTMIVEEAQQRSMQDFQESLRSNRHRKTFNKLYKATLAEQGDVFTARAEVISAMKNIQNKDDVFAVLTRTNKAMNKNGVKFTAEGNEIKLNGVSIDMGKYASMSKPQAEAFLGKLAEGSATSGEASNSIPTNSRSVQNILSSVELKCRAAMTSIEVVTCFQKVVSFADASTKERIAMVLEFLVDAMTPAVMMGLKNLFPEGTLLRNLVLMITEYFCGKAAEYDEKYQRWKQTGEACYYEPFFDKVDMSLVAKAVSIFELVVGMAFNAGHLKYSATMDIIEYFNAWLTKKFVDEEVQKEKEKSREIHSAGRRPKKLDCKECGGYYFSLN